MFCVKYFQWHDRYNLWDKFYICGVSLQIFLPLTWLSALVRKMNVRFMTLPHVMGKPSSSRCHVIVWHHFMLGQNKISLIFCANHCFWKLAERKDHWFRMNFFNLSTCLSHKWRIMCVHDGHIQYQTLVWPHRPIIFRCTNNAQSTCMKQEKQSLYKL